VIPLCDEGIFLNTAGSSDFFVSLVLSEQEKRIIVTKTRIQECVNTFLNDGMKNLLTVRYYFFSPVYKRYFFQTAAATLRPNFRPSILSD